MRYALFRCCTSAPHMPEYELATDIVLSRMEVDSVSVPEFGCCGYPLRNLDQKAWLLASARNLALAQAYRAAIVTVCNCCYGTLRHCIQTLAQSSELYQEINSHLKTEGLTLDLQAQVKHLLQVLAQDIGLKALRQKVQRPADDMNLALHYGCRILRPSSVLKMEDPFRPKTLETLVEAVNARTLAWERKLDCCGAPVWATDEKLSDTIAAGKISEAQAAGADGICVVCPFCQLRLEGSRKKDSDLPVIAYPQLLAYCLGGKVNHPSYTLTD